MLDRRLSTAIPASASQACSGARILVDRSYKLQIRQLSSLASAIIILCSTSLYGSESQTQASDATHSSSPSPNFPPSLPLERPPEPTTVVTGFTNVYAAPSEGASIVEKIKMGELLTIVETQESWVKVRRDRAVIGWIHKTNLSTP